MALGLSLLLFFVLFFCSCIFLSLLNSSSIPLVMGHCLPACMTVSTACLHDRFHCLHLTLLPATSHGCYHWDLCTPLFPWPPPVYWPSDQLQALLYPLFRQASLSRLPGRAASSRILCVVHRWRAKLSMRSCLLVSPRPCPP